MIDADVREYLARHRLPDDVPYSAQVTIASRAEDVNDPKPLLASLAAGYTWGATVGIFAVISDSQREAIDALAARYFELLAHRDGANVMDQGAFLAEATFALSAAKMIFHEDPPEATIDDAYDGVGANTLDLLGYGAVRESKTMRGGFHLGAAMFAAETALADALMFRARLAHVEGSERRSRIARVFRVRR